MECSYMEVESTPNCSSSLMRMWEVFIKSGNMFLSLYSLLKIVFLQSIKHIYKIKASI